MPQLSRTKVEKVEDIEIEGVFRI